MSDDIFIGNVAIGITASAVGLAAKIREQVVPSASGIGDEWGGKFREGVNGRLGDVVGRWSSGQADQAAAGGTEAAAKYADSFKAKIDEALRDIPPVELTANATEADRTIQGLRDQLEELHSKTIGIDLSGAEATAELDKIQAKMMELRDNPTMATVDFHDVNWQESMDKVTALREIASKPIIQKIDVVSGGVGGASAEKTAERDGEMAGAGWGSRFMAKIKGITGNGGAAFSGLGNSVKERGAKDGEEYSGKFGGVLSSSFGVGGLVTLGVVGGLGLMAKKAGDFEEGITRLNTAAGESAKNLPMVAEGIKKIAAETGTSLDQLNKGAFMVESAGFHGAAGLKVLRAAAEGAKISGADLGIVSNATTTVMNDFGLSADKSSNAVSGLNAIVSHGKTTLQDLASSASKFLPTASALHVSFGDVGGAMATLTGEGISAKLAAQGLNTAMLALAAPNKVAKKTMEEMGISSQKVASDLTKHGLTYALDEVAKAALRAGPQGSAPYIAALKDMTGGNRGLQIALGLTGDHMKTTQSNVEAVGKAYSKGGKDVTGWAKTQEDFNFKLNRAKMAFEVVGITIGQKVMPIFSKLMDFMASHIGLVEIIAGVIGVTLVAAFAAAAIAAISFWTAATAGIALVVTVLIVVVVKYHKQILNFIVETWHKVLNFIKEWMPIFIAVVTGGFGLIVFFVMKYHTQIWHFIQSVWHDILGFFDATWDDIKKIFNDSLGWLGHLWNSAWNGIKNDLNAVWTDVKKGVGDVMQWIENAFQNGVTGVKRIWDGIEAIAKAPVSFIVNTVYNRGIVPIVNDIAGVFGVHPLHTVSGFARGTGGAPPGWAWIGEEGPELVHMTGGETVLDSPTSMSTGLWGKGTGYSTGFPGHAPAPVAAHPGGDLSKIGAKTRADATGPNVISAIGHDVMSTIKTLTGDALGAALNAVVNPLLNHIPGLDNNFGKYVKNDVVSMEKQLINYIVGLSTYAGGGANGAALLKDAERFRGHKYVYGGPSNPSGGFDCSSFASYILGHDFKMAIPGGSWARVTNNGASHGPTASAYKGWSGASNKSDQNLAHIAAGDLLTWDTHVGFGAGNNKMFSAYDTASGILMTAASAGPSGEKLLIRQIKGMSGGGPLGGATGSDAANAAEGFQYLRQYLFNGNKIAAAGAVASIYGESSWNPFSQGTGGRGLIGWTPPGSISDSAFHGGMSTQLPAILEFVRKNGDMGTIAAMMRAGSVLSAANLWGHGVERFGINDVHPAGISLATGIMNKYANGTDGAAPGWAMVGENGMELVNMRGGETVLTHEQSLSALGQIPGMSAYAAGTMSGMQQGDMHRAETASIKDALRDVEALLKANVNATKGVGGDVAASMNKQGRPARNSGAWNNGLGR